METYQLMFNLYFLLKNKKKQGQRKKLIDGCRYVKERDFNAISILVICILSSVLHRYYNL